MAKSSLTNIHTRKIIAENVTFHNLYMSKHDQSKTKHVHLHLKLAQVLFYPENPKMSSQYFHAFMILECDGYERRIQDPRIHLRCRALTKSFFQKRLIILSKCSILDVCGNPRNTHLCVVFGEKSLILYSLSGFYSRERTLEIISRILSQCLLRTDH